MEPGSGWEMGLLAKSEWKARWIGLDLNRLCKGKVYHLPPAPYLRKQIRIKPHLRKATLYITALGLYEFSMNGTKISDALSASGHSDLDYKLF